MAGVLLTSGISIGFNYVFPVTRAYYQLVDPGANSCPQFHLCKKATISWPRLNHTLTVSANAVESYLVLTAVEEPRPSSLNVTLEILFTSPDTYLTPEVTGGSVKWLGELHQGQSTTIKTSIRLPSDGAYFIGGLGVSYVSGGHMGVTTRYYLQVQGGIVVKVSNTPEFSSDIELKCLSNC